MLRYPASRAVCTTCALSSGGTWNTPRPSCGICTPLFNVTLETVIPLANGSTVRLLPRRVSVSGTPGNGADADIVVSLATLAHGHAAVRLMQFGEAFGARRCRTHGGSCLDLVTSVK